jgi:hypothetical protein
LSTSRQNQSRRMPLRLKTRDLSRDLCSQRAKPLKLQAEGERFEPGEGWRPTTSEKPWKHLRHKGFEALTSPIVAYPKRPETTAHFPPEVQPLHLAIRLLRSSGAVIASGPARKLNPVSEGSSAHRDAGERGGDRRTASVSPPPPRV